ncbi:biofilm formation regulator HmsP [Rouxiella badensis]|nr:biofilm formation regulator HmsP [Rouxiella badensis]QOI57742.1 biofilm formation regulator HmsP [Rouxiella badensis subsp. acadiensis]
MHFQDSARRERLRVRRSLTIKQMAAVSGVALVTICFFIAIQLFHFVEQRRDDYAQQLENIGHSVVRPLSQSVLNVDLKETQHILNTLRPVGILNRAEVVLPNRIPTLSTHFPEGRPVPDWVMASFDLPIKVSVPLYSPAVNPTTSQPIAYLVLQADPYRMYQFFVSALSTLLTTYLLLALVLSIAISWCINRLIIHPLRSIARELESLPESEVHYHQLAARPRHRDDELGILIRSYNRNQQLLDKALKAMQETRESFPNEEQFVSRVEQRINGSLAGKDFHIMLICIENVGEGEGAFCPVISSLLKVLPEQSLLARLGYNEFAVMVSEIERPFMAMRLARELMASINTPQTTAEMGITLHPTGSIGIAQYIGRQAISGHQLLTHARAARLSADRQGKNQILFFEPGLTAKIHRRLLQENEILHAMEKNDFTLFIQPQVNMSTGEVMGAEAFLRRKMNDGSYGLESDFIVVAEEIGVMAQLGYKMLELGCHILADWRRRDITLPLSLSLSGVQIQQANFLPELRSLISRYQIDNGQLVLEITETARIADWEQALIVLAELRRLGISVELDDFGLGYSGLEYLNRLRNVPINAIKIDRIFVASLPEDDAMANIVASIARAMNIKLKAEGVETEAQRGWLLNNRILFGQGYLFSAPVPLVEFETKFLLNETMV